MAKTSIVDKINALLRKAESTEFEEEADAFLAKAQELMLQHAIDDDALRAASGQARASVDQELVSIPERDEIASEKRAILATLARHNRCKTIVLIGRGQTALIGTADDRAFVLQMFGSIIFQHSGHLGRAWRSAPRDHSRKDQGRYLFKVNFASGFASRLVERVAQNAALAEQAVRQAGSSTDMVLVRGADVKAFIKEQYPRLVTTRSAGHVNRTGARNAGRNAADRTDIGGGHGHLAGQKAVGA